MQSYLPRPELSQIATDLAVRERYQILGRIASGAMGQVYLARMRRTLGGWKEVALKRIRPELQLDKGVIEMFYDEARITSQLDHPGIIRIYELGELDGSLFLSMELVEGVNLSALLAHLVQARRPLPLDIGLNFGAAALEALSYAHRFREPGTDRPLNIVHRDVSPQNLLISFRGELKLFDFGITKAEGRLHKTHPGLLKGKLGYMAPELIRGEEVDARADLFALGALLFEALLFRHPFYGKTDAMVLRAIVDSPPLHPLDLDPTFPPELTAILLRSLEKDPARRYPDAETMLAELRAFMQSRGVAPSLRRVSEFMRTELIDRLQQIAQARAAGDDEALVVAMQGRPAKKTPYKTSAPKALPPPSTPAQPTAHGRPPSSAAPKPEFQLPHSRERLDYAQLPTADIPANFRPRTEDLPMARASVKEILRDELGHTPALGTPTLERVGRYTLLEPLRTTRLFELRRASQDGPRGYQKLVALRRLVPAEAARPGADDTLAREARAAADWRHPSLLQVIDFGVERTGYLVEELVQGQQLDQLLERCRSARRTIAVPVAVRIAAALAAGLRYLHRRREVVTHRDVGPHHVSIARHGAVKLGGFTHARVGAVPIGELFEDRRPRMDIAPPERLAPELGVEGPPSDVYALGLLLDELLTLEPLFGRPTPFEVRRAVLDGAKSSAAERREGLPPRLVTLLDRSLALLPTERPAAAELERELERVLIELGEPFTAADLADWLSEVNRG